MESLKDIIKNKIKSAEPQMVAILVVGAICILSILIHCGIIMKREFKIQDDIRNFWYAIDSIKQDLSVIKENTK